MSSMPFSGTLSHMASGMKVVVIAGDILHVQEIIGHGHMGKFPDFGVFGTGIERVGRMGNNFAEVMFCGETAVTAASFSSMALALPPLGFLVKNCKVSAFIEMASFAIFSNPLADVRWHPKYIMCFSLR